MIALSQPALALHSCDVPGYLYQMKTDLENAGRSITVERGLLDRVRCGQSGGCGAPQCGDQLPRRTGRALCRWSEKPP